MEDVALFGKVRNKSGVKRQPKNKKRAITVIDPEDTEHMLVYGKLIKYYETFMLFFGTKARYDWKPEKNFLFWTTYGVIYMVWLSIVYTIGLNCYYGSYSRIMEPLAIIGISSSVKKMCKSVDDSMRFSHFFVQGHLKWKCHVKNQLRIVSLLFYTRKICLVNPTGVSADIIRNGLLTTEKVLKVYLVCVLSALMFYMSVPLHSLIIKKVMLPLMPLEFPYVDQVSCTTFM